MTTTTTSHDTKEKSFNATVDLVENYAIFTLDRAGKIQSWNRGAEMITGYAKEAVTGQDMSFLYPDKIANKFKPAEYFDYAAKNGTYAKHGWRTRKDGSKFLADINISAIRDPAAGNVTGYICIIKDITQQRIDENAQSDANDLLKEEISRRQRIEKALKASNAELDAFASAASHDLQEPLRMVISYLQLIDRRYRQKLDADGKEFLDFAKDGATRMRTLISDLVEYARVDTVKKPVRQIDMNRILREVLKNLSVSSDEAHVMISYDDLPVLMGDEVQISQVLQNLIANAIKFSDKKQPRVHIGVEKGDKEYTFRVEDNGKGIPKKEFENIFLIFKQLGSRASRQGSGVGLALVKKIITRHRGRIWVESEVGEGSTFYFTLPVTAKVKESHRA